MNKKVAMHHSLTQTETSSASYTSCLYMLLVYFVWALLLLLLLHT